MLRRKAFSSAPFLANTSSPSKKVVPPVNGVRRRIVRPMVVLPQPDSPTRPSVSPWRTVKLTPSTAFTQAVTFCNTPERTGKYFFRSCTTSRSLFAVVIVAMPTPQRAR